MNFLLDSNPCVVYLRGKNSLLRQRISTRPPSEIVLCSIVVAELFHGAERSADPTKSRIEVETFIKPFHSLPFDDDAARQYARIRFDLETRGMRIGDNDMLIAAIAMNNNLTLVTHNTAEFSRIPNLPIVDCEAP